MQRPTWLFAAACATTGAFIAVTVIGVIGAFNWDVSLTSEASAAWIQAIGSVGAIFVTIRVWVHQAKLTRDLQKQSMQPHLEIRTTRQSIRPNIKIELVNVGVGPAIIKALNVKLDGNPFTPNPAFFGPELGARLELGVGGWGGGTIPEIDDWLPAGEPCILFAAEIGDTVAYENLTANHNAGLDVELARVQFVIAYESVFGQRWVANSTH